MVQGAPSGDALKGLCRETGAESPLAHSFALSPGGGPSLLWDERAVGPAREGDWDGGWQSRRAKTGARSSEQAPCRRPGARRDGAGGRSAPRVEGPPEEAGPESHRRKAGR